jgi:PHD/YefM family antitoxin component YafN of YafNO toxin-antitoxin module
MKRTVSAMEFRRNLGEILEGVFYRGDEVKIERNGKLMGVIVSPERYEQTERSRHELLEMVREVWERNEAMDPNEAAAIAMEAVSWARQSKPPHEELTEDEATQLAAEAVREVRRKNQQRKLAG